VPDVKRMRILVANEPRMYRDVLATALQALRPHVAVMTSDPADLDRNVARFEPHLVLCTHLTEAVQTDCLAWIVFYPNGTRIVEVANSTTTQPIGYAIQKGARR